MRQEEIILAKIKEVKDLIQALDDHRKENMEQHLDSYIDYRLKTSGFKEHYPQYSKLKSQIVSYYYAHPYYTKEAKKALDEAFKSMERADQINLDNLDWIK